jgi:hypothetical protein
VAMYYYCLYRTTWDQKYLGLYQQYATAYKNCIQ